MAISRQREAYILARDHGWIELTVSDAGIPARIRGESKMAAPPEPPYCSIELHADGEPYLDDVIYPKGEVPPYTVASGFRFPVPTGVLQLRVSYRGCHPLSAEDAGERQARLQVMVQKDQVSLLGFDGFTLVEQGVKLENQPTLETLNAKLDALLRHSGE